MPQIRVTMPTLAVVAVIAAAMATDDEVWGLRICQATGLGSGTVYPILERLEEAGWIASTWEGAQPPGRPRRRFYQLTDAGRIAYGEALAARAARRRMAGRLAHWSTP